MTQTTTAAKAVPATACTSALILVVGSINMDLVVRCSRIPASGETLLGSDFTRHPGGKGANGATAAGRLADPQRQRVTMLGAVGRDNNGTALRRNLRERGVDVGRVRELDGVPTGVALIIVSDAGDNSIVVVPGANGRLRPEDIEVALPSLSPTVVLMQLEIPLETVARGAALGHEAGARVLLDPAPAPEALSEDLLGTVDVLMPNEGELAALTGMHIETEEAAARAAARLRERGVKTVVVKRGAKGALIVDAHGARPVGTPRVRVVDTTGAGDCFDGALAVALSEGQALDAAVRFATQAAALACTRLGAQEAQPTREEVERMLA